MTGTLVLGAVAVLAFVAWHVECERHRRTIRRAQIAEADRDIQKDAGSAR